MRLSKIKLAGFKSFVDPTTLQLSTNLTGIVGPNGCGKSNTIDAVRWVMGESSAKHLRGASMTDVIFSGSSSRKPVGQASVELVFDNSEGKLGGQWAGYTEIALRRQVTREGQSQYFLNGTKCRRRDITDIFLGTGLGPRSYAIIEQGMISRLIDAKPEEMRVYLEEAAGISKYKERRRETENRIRHTRDNLDRLNDLREEVDKQLAHLQRQSRTAEKYKTLKVDEKQFRGELLGLRWLEYQEALNSFDTRVQERESNVALADEKRAEAEENITIMRDKRTEVEDQLNDVQGKFYAVGAEITRAEQSIQHARDEREKRARELQRIDEETTEIKANIEDDVQRIMEVEEALAEAGPTRDKIEREQQEATQRYEKAESDFQDGLASWEELNSEHSEQEMISQVESSRLGGLLKNVTDLKLRQERLQRERAELSERGEDTNLNELVSDQKSKSTEELAMRGQLDSATIALTQVREKVNYSEQQLDTKRTELQSSNGRLASLQALQQAATGGSEKKRVEWLEKNGLADAPPLLKLLDIDSGWEKAIEVVLGDFLDAICVDDFDALSEKLSSLPEAGVNALRDGVKNDSVDDEQKWLATVVNSRAGIAELLHGVTICENNEEAFAARESLKPGESVVTRDGLWMGRHWLCVRPTDGNGSVLERQEELESLQQKVKLLKQDISTIEEALEQQKQQVVERENNRDKLQTLINARHREISTLNGKIESAQSQIDQADERTSKVDSELEEIDAVVSRTTREHQEAAKRAEDAEKQFHQLQQRLAEMDERRQDVLEQRNEARQALDQVRESGQATIVKLESMKSGRESIEQNRERMTRQLEQLTMRRQELDSQQQPDNGEIELLKTQHLTLLRSRSEIESTLQSARKALEEHDNQQRQQEQNRHRLEQAATQARELLQQVNMESQESRVRLKTIDEQLVEAEIDREALLPTIPEEASVEVWAEQLAEVERKIQKLGPINLAAIEEYQEQLQRKEYLDEQFKDITDALETLEEAIHKIDRETRTMFSETFEAVNTKLQELFPKLFGGGEAKLELIGDDLLEAGVAVMARPPGKRVTSIQLLSGGEKALTAVAMVFAFFHLRPSPFCMLDEVDAPLDDANVSRFAKMVEEMSSQVQFIFITHNKVTMELSNQLMGVTMQEPGVSRLVTVDVDEAVELAVA